MWFEEYRRKSINLPVYLFLGQPYKNLNVGVPKEILENERRVAITPAGVKILSKIGYNVNIEKGAGNSAQFSDAMYKESGASLTDRANALGSDIVLKVCFLYFW